MTTDFSPPFVQEWLATIQPASFEEAIPEPASAAIFSADMINGFLHFGPLASDRVRALADPVASLFERAWEHGVRNFVLCQDTHHPETPEFEAYPPHCLPIPRSRRRFRNSRACRSPVPSRSSRRIPSARRSTPPWTSGSRRTPRSRPRSWLGIVPTSAPTNWRCTSGCEPTR